MSIKAKTWTGGGSSVSVPDASETTKGKIQIATSAEATTGTDDLKAMTPLTVKERIDAAIVGGVEYKGVFNVTSATPDISNAEKGDMYIVSGSATLYGKSWVTGDHLLINDDMSGSISNSKIDKIDNTDQVTSVNAQTGAVSLSGNDLDGDHTASNYSTTSDKIEKHLEGIDNKFGTLGTASTKDTGVANGNVIVADATGLPVIDGSQLTGITATDSSKLAIANNLSDLNNVGTARTNLGLGTASTKDTGVANGNVIVADATGLPVIDGSQLTGITATDSTKLAIANNLSDLNNVGTARTNLGLGTASTSASSDFLAVSNNLSDLNNVGTARTNLGLGTASTKDTGVANGNVIVADATGLPVIDGSQLTGITATDATKLAIANNLSDLNNVGTARTNLGLGTASTKDTGVANGNVIVADATGLPVIDGSQLTGITATDSTKLAIANNLSDLNNVGTARTNLGLVIGTDVAAIASPAFTGSPTAPTQSASDNSTNVATTAYVDAAVVAGGGLSSVVQDTTPQLGGPLDVNGQAITSASNGNVSINPDGTGIISAGADLIPDTNVTHTIGSEDYRYISTYSDLNGAVRFKAKNDQGASISKGQVVYLKGVSGTVPTVGLARANSASTMPAFGLAYADANDQAEVQIITFGNLTDYNTTTFSLSLNDTVFVSSATAGSLTNAAPTGESNLIQNIGRVVRADASAGIIKVGGAGRSAATPNLDDGDIFIGNVSNQSSSVALSSVAQLVDAGLTSIAGLTTAADKMIFTTASDTYAVTSLTSAGRDLLDDANASAQRTTLGLVIGTDVAPIAAPAFTGNATAVTQSQSDGSTKIATTAYVDTAVAGASGYTYSAKTASFTAAADYHYSCTNAITATLPAASSNANKPIRIKVMGTGTVTIARDGSDKIDGVASDYSMTIQYSSITLFSNGSDGWEII